MPGKKHQSVRLDEDLIDDLRSLLPSLNGLNNSAILDFALREAIESLKSKMGSVAIDATSAESIDDIDIGL